ncbi:MAG: hypothetical protein ACK58B_15420 [Dolichospermum sp.]
MTREQGTGFGQLYFSLLTALPGVMRYIFSGQDARTTRVLLLISVLHNIGNCCIYSVNIANRSTINGKFTSVGY